IRPGHIVVEAGANVGVHTLVMARLVGETGMVYAFEPHRLVFQALCANVALNSITNVHCRPEALGEQPGWLSVPSWSPECADHFEGMGLPQNERTPVTTVDGLDLPRCEFLKVDAGGREL